MQLIDSAWLDDCDSEIILSVVITNYNYAPFVERAVSSVVSQLEPGIELIVIDDGSSDDSVGILASLDVPATFRCAYTVQENAGPAAARNAAARLSRGEWVLYLDADDELIEGGLVRIKNFLYENPETDLLLCGMRTKHEGGKELYRAPAFLEIDKKNRLVSYLIDKKVRVSHGSSVFRRECVLKRPYPEHLRQGEDIAVFAFMLSQPTCHRLDIPVARIHKHRSSLRHDAGLVVKNNELIAAEVFSSLPSIMHGYFNAYRAKRALSAFRTCYKAGRKKDAQRYFHAAVSFDMRQALSLKYIYRYAKLLFMRS